MPTGTTVKNTGLTGDDTINEIKAASQAPDEKPAPVAFPDIQGEGQEAFMALVQFIDNVMDAGYSLADADTWKQAGLRGHGHLTQIASRYALQAARKHYDAALSKAGFIATYETLQHHPAYEYEAALGWLFKTNHKLFDDRTYAHLGGSAQVFYERMQKAFCDLVFQSVRVADAMLDADENDSNAFGVIHTIWAKHFDRLGVQEITDHVANLTGITAGELDAVEYRATQAKLRTQLRESDKLRWAGRNSHDYCHALIAAWETADNDTSVMDDARTFDGTNFTANAFALEVERAVGILISHELVQLREEKMSMSGLESFIENLAHWRAFFENVDEPEDVSPEHIGEDFWCAGLLSEFGYRNYTHLMHRLHSLYAGNRAVSILSNRAAEEPDAVYDALMDARDALAKGNISISRLSAFQEVGLDRDEFNLAMSQTAPSVVERNWNESFHPGLRTDERLKLLMDASEAMGRISGTEHAQYLPRSIRMLGAQEERFKMRRAEEILALSLATVKDHNAYGFMQPAMNMLAEMKRDIFASDFRARAGMTEARARELNDLYERADMIALWRAATDENESAMQRLVYVIEFHGRLGTMDGLDSLELLLSVEKGGWDDYQAKQREIADEAMNESVARMGEVPHDTLSNAQYLQVIRNALNLINPDALEHPAVFKRLTNKDLAEFLSIEKDTQARIDQLCAPDSDVFHITLEEASQRLVAIRAMPFGAEGWHALRNLRHDATITGFSIAGEHVLDAAGMDYNDLAQLNTHHALYAAQAHMTEAMAKGPGPVSLSNLGAHAYHNYEMVRKWVARAGVNALANEAYEFLGLAGRVDFIDCMRESLFDYILQIESAIFRENITTVGPVGYLEAMHELRNGYQILGFEAPRDEIADTPDDVSPNAVSVSTVRVALRKFAPTACLSILNSDKTLSAKHRGVRRLMAFGARMNVNLPDTQATQVINVKLTDVVLKRLTKILDSFAKKPDDMARGWRVARAINQTRILHSLDDVDWFNPLFQRLGYGDFKAFCEDMAIKRLDQINRRCTLRLRGADAQTQASFSFNRDLIVDFHRMNEVIESPLLANDRINTVLDHAHVDTDIIETNLRRASAFALPTFTDIAYDPTLRVNERHDLMLNIIKLQELAGSKNRLIKDVNLDQVQEVYTDMVCMMTGHYLMREMMRGDKPGWSPILMHVNALMDQAMLSLGDMKHLQAIGLDEEEAAQYAMLHPLRPVYTMVTELDGMAPGRNGVGEIHNVLMRLYRYTADNNINLDNPAVQIRVGVRTPQEMSRIVEGPALMVARSLSSAMKTTQDPAYGMEAGKRLKTFMEASQLEKRHGARMLQEQGIFDRVMLGQMIGRFGQMRKLTRQKPGQV